MERKIHESVESFFKAIAPLVDEPHRRVDDREARLMGRAWDERGVAHLISIDVFKATGDIEKFRELWESKFGKDRKPRPQPDPPADEAAEAESAEDPAPTVH